MGDRILQELQYDTDHTANAALDGAGNLAITVRRTDPKLRDHGELRQGPDRRPGDRPRPGYAGAAGITASDQAETSLADDFHRIYTSPPARRS
jgi:hypothetical protein